MIFAVVKRYETEDMDFFEWVYKPNDFDGVYGRIYLITGSHEIAQDVASWVELAAEGETYEFNDGEVEMQLID